MITSPFAISTSEVADHYNSLDAFYRDIWGEHVHHGYWENGDETSEEAILHLSNVLIGWLNLKAGASVCDLGCGYGGTSRLLANHYAAKVMGYTLSERQKDFAESIPITQGKVEYRCQDFMHNNLEKGRICRPPHQADQPWSAHYSSQTSGSGLPATEPMRNPSGRRRLIRCGLASAPQALSCS
ncbi:MAG: class I SAM-dependent methyltransferase [Chitinophagaceae bacterium]|nr:class I SAM-dependent methyltransferase [Oligoflexus sp.]